MARTTRSTVGPSCSPSAERLLGLSLSLGHYNLTLHRTQARPSKSPTHGLARAAVALSPPNHQHDLEQRSLARAPPSFAQRLLERGPPAEPVAVLAQNGVRREAQQRLAHASTGPPVVPDGILPQQVFDVLALLALHRLASAARALPHCRALGGTWGSDEGPAARLRRPLPAQALPRPESESCTQLQRLARIPQASQTRQSKVLASRAFIGLVRAIANIQPRYPSAVCSPDLAHWQW
ncbi:uncharacterized protein FIBRA_00783 [Fibroporia radiculosa]|uniref:Uncharacterized protein n=1 Tax=Fibroporia radiculosa TaxID=599839 RepID=J4G0L6_9APHY|nr:uncharacterized protein FIBRA_00783 [Fibroporia radiculosa]CCL98778.1 predicted protein [Fibroporia radiculosa]